MANVTRFLALFLNISLLILVVTQLEPPKTLTVDPLKVLAFLLPFTLTLTLLADFYFKYLFKSLILSLGGSLILILQALGKLNLITFLPVILVIFILLRVVKKPPLSYQSKIPRLSRLKRQ